MIAALFTAIASGFLTITSVAFFAEAYAEGRFGSALLYAFISLVGMIALLRSRY